MENNKEQKLFDDNDESWRAEWMGMPEFIQGKSEKPYAQVIFRFANEKDLQDFAKIINQKLTRKTKSAWHPQIVRGLDANKIYIQQEDDTDND